MSLRCDPFIFYMYPKEEPGIFVTSNSVPNQNFTIIPNEIVRSKEITPEGKAILIYFLGNDPSFKVYKRSLPERLGMSRGAVDRAFQNLKQLGYMEEERIRDRHGVYQGIKYTIQSYSKKAISSEINHNTKTRHLEIVHYKNTNNIKNTNILNIEQDENFPDFLR